MRCGGQVVYCEDRHQGALLCLGGGGYTEPVSPRPLHLHRISSLGSNVGGTRFETACAPAHSRQSDRRASRLSVRTTAACRLFPSGEALPSTTSAGSCLPFVR